MQVKVKLKEVLEKRNMTQGELSKLTGISQAQISLFSLNQKNTINKTHLVKIAEALGITEIGELVELE